MRKKPVSNPLSISLRKPVGPKSIITVFLWVFFILSRRKQDGEMLWTFFAFYLHFWLIDPNAIDNDVTLPETIT